MTWTGMEGEMRHFELDTDEDRPVVLKFKAHCWNCEKDLAIGTRAYYEEDYETTYNPETGQIDGTDVSAGFECEPCHWE